MVVWSLYLQLFDFSITHCLGQRNGNADGLSREFCPNNVANDHLTLEGGGGGGEVSGSYTP